MDAANLKSINFKRCLVPCIKILVVDSDLKCLQILSKMLSSLGYDVDTASKASEALSIFEERKNELDLLLVEVDLPDMEIGEFTEKIRESSDMPYCLMTADSNVFSKSRIVCYGAQLYFRKPIMIHDLTGLWKLTTQMKNKYKRLSSEIAKRLRAQQQKPEKKTLGTTAKNKCVNGN
ncbi:hypothetical protein RJT34_15430 [Clitoria ternatea]|uniref:Response regulatory domain-containing protein n=1 Tax=Clitoria ternatea TaxID=43366 RepID=A0AAN9PCR1_CLITE